MSEQITGPHQGQPLIVAVRDGRPQGSPLHLDVGAGLAPALALESARSAMIMIHGRGATAQDILSLTADLPQPGFVFLAPQAAGNTWYPNSFLQPIASNEPGISSGHAVIASLLDQLAQAGISAERTILLGFSQGACLLTEYVARNAHRYGGVAGLSGGLIGPDGTPRDYPGSLAGTPVFLGCSDIDPHIPKERVLLTAEVLQRLDAKVTTHLYPRLGHTVNRDELRSVQAMMAALS